MSDLPQMIQELRLHQMDLQKQLKAVDNAMNELRQICNHQWQSDDGHGYGVGTYTCTVCGMSSEDAKNQTKSNF
ncbi:MAG: hypothetical protein LC105_06075 [Chitinophagales bacterium]|nr:hypothetical protein [Chitinophagales bacterium]